MTILWRKKESWYIEQTETGLHIRHPGAVVLLPITAVGDVLILRQYRAAIDKTIWELPAGTRGWNEPWEACAQRELREEAGVRAQKFTHLGDIWPAASISNELMRLYLAEELTPDPLPQDDDEQIEVVPLPLPELIHMAIDGRLQDAKSITAVLRYSGKGASSFIGK